MRRSVLSRLTLVAGLAAAAAFAPGCGTMHDVGNWFRRGDMITYQQYQSIDSTSVPPPTVDDVINTLGKPNDIHDRDGARVRLDYWALSLNDELKRAQFSFDKSEKLTKKELW